MSFEIFKNYFNTMEVRGVSDQNQTKFAIEKDEPDRESSRISNTPMGDFEYDEVAVIPLSSDCSSSDFSEDVAVSIKSDTNEKFLLELKNQLHQINSELRTMIERIDNTEEDVLRRRDFYRDMERLSLEYSKQIGREVEQSEKIEHLIDNLRVDIRRRDESLENMTFLENNQFTEHINRKSESAFTCCRDTEVYCTATP